jgi:hypothetical protein
MREDMDGVFRNDPVEVARGLSVLRKAYQILCSCGHDDLYGSSLRHLESGLASVHADCVKLLAAKLNDPATSPEDRELIRQFFEETRAGHE